MNIALIAHDNKKELMAQFCTAYCGILAQHTLCATATTGPDHLRGHGADHPPVPVLLPRRRPADRCPHRLQRDRSGAVLRRSPQQGPQRGHRQHLSPVRPRTTSPTPAIWPRQRCWCWVWPAAIWIGATSSIPKPSPLPLDISLHIPYNRLRSNRYDGA